MRLGCHAVMFGPRLSSETEKVVSRLAKTGFQGIEVGSRFMVNTGDSERIAGAAARYGLEISAVHVSGALANFVDRPVETVAEVMKAVEIVAGLANKNVSMTGQWVRPGEEAPDTRLKDAGFVRQVAHAINTVVIGAKERGVAVNYHNHNWEFENDALVFKTLMNDAPQVNFALDTGWAFTMGHEPAALIRSAPGRFPYVHLRDYSAEFGDFVNLGEGDIDYPDLLEAAEAAVGSEGWAIVEYETGTPNYKRYTTAHVYLEYLLGARKH